MPRPSATFTVWASAWLAGAAAPDDVLDALGPWALAHDVQAADEATADTTTLPPPGSPVSSLAFLLALLRRTTPRGPARLVLPVPGDVRGLPGPGAFSREATAAGEGVLFADAGLGIVPTTVAENVLRWTVFPVPDPGPPVEFVALGQAERELREQVRQSASVLTSLGVARHRPGVREEIAAALRARPESLWPAGMPGQALRVLQHADEVEAILAAASVDEPGGALSASAAAARREALRPIETAVRIARRAAVAEAVRVLAASPLV
ncbi:hypothetical protein [Pseudonocardia sp.]|uniref:hypothetical protein n=1 Tax=Pseudonocardia sp. TaxID=60912 RepID=UPI002638D73E|nr:hypothetical protein [Pseudonocardia sp.]